MISPDKILICCQSPVREPYSGEVELLFKSIQIFGGELASAKKMVCFSAPVDVSIKNRLEKFDVNIETIEPLNVEYKTANKIQLLNKAMGQDFDYLIALDTDILILRDFSHLIDGDNIKARIVGQDALGLDNWKTLFQYFNMEFPSKRYVALDGKETIPYYNSGVLFIPRNKVKLLYETWKSFITKLPEAYEEFPSLSTLSFFTDQIAFSLALSYQKFESEPLPLEMNFPSQNSSIVSSFKPEIKNPYALHYHHAFSDSGKISHGPYQNINDLIDKSFQKLSFDSSKISTLSSMVQDSSQKNSILTDQILEDQIIKKICIIGKKNWTLKKKKFELEDLKNKISNLENESKLKDSQIENFKKSINEIQESFTGRMLRKYDQIMGKNRKK